MFLITTGLLYGCSEPENPEAGEPVVAEIGSAETASSNDLEQDLKRSESDRHLLVVADPWCPHNCLAGSEKEGYMVDIAREAMAGSGYTLEYQNISWARALKMTRDGQAHAVVGAFRTDAPDFVFPEVAQGRASISLFTHPASDWTYRGMASLEGQTLLAINGYSYTEALDSYIDSNRDNPERIWILSGPAPLKRALSLLEKDRTDIFAEDDYVMAWVTMNDPDIERPRRAGQVGETLSYLAFSPALESSPELARVLSEGTRTLIESGRVNAILESYGLIDLPEMP